MRWSFVLLLMCLPGFAIADVLIAARTIRSQEIIDWSDVTVTKGTIAGAFSHPDEVVGLEARVALFAGRPILVTDVGPAALVERNAQVRLIYMRGGLTIATEARALGRGAAGDTIRVMNLASHATLFGRIETDGTVTVSD